MFFTMDCLGGSKSSFNYVLLWFFYNVLSLGRRQTGATVTTSPFKGMQRGFMIWVGGVVSANGEEVIGWFRQPSTYGMYTAAPDLTPSPPTTLVDIVLTIS